MLENEVKKQICTYLEHFQNQGKLIFWVTDTTGTYDSVKKTFRRRNSRHQRNGIPDIICLIKVLGIPLFVGLEVKTKTGKQTDSQKEFEASIEYTFGKGYYFVVRDIDGVRSILEKIGIVSK